MFTVKSNFIGSYKVGDNINHNTKILIYLYRQYDRASTNEKRYLCKPIIIFISSIIEAVLHDFYYRVNKFTIEGVRNIATDIINEIRGKEINAFQKYLDNSRKHNIFSAPDERFYDLLERVKKLRDRIHIQNTKQYEPLDEYEAFTEDEKRITEMACEAVLKTMFHRYKRGDIDYVKDFILPWEEHIKQTPHSNEYLPCPSCKYPRNISTTVTSYICPECSIRFQNPHFVAQSDTNP